MGWVTPGEPYTVKIDGKDVKFKPLTNGERKAIIDRVAEWYEHLKATENDEGPDVLRDILSESVVSVGGYKDDMAAFMEVQHNGTINALYHALLFGSTINGEQAKN